MLLVRVSQCLVVCPLSCWSHSALWCAPLSSSAVELVACLSFNELDVIHKEEHKIALLRESREKCDRERYLCVKK